MKKLVLLSVLLGSLLSSFGQNVEFKASNFPNDKPGFRKAMTNYRKGMKYFEMGPSYFENALHYYLLAEDFNPNEAQLNYQIGVVYNVLRNERAISYLEKAIQLDSKYKVHAAYTLAQAYHVDGQWDKAISKYQEYIQNLETKRPTLKKPERVLIDIDITDAKLRIQQCENGKKYSDLRAPMLVKNLGDAVNTKGPDYAPVTNASHDTLLFTTRRDGVKGKKYSPYDIYPFEDIYYSVRNADGTWQEAKPVPGSVNTRKHEASVWMSQDSRTLFVYKYKQNGNLYQSKFESGKWTKPKKIKHVNSRFRETHASMTADGKTIYFTSDNPKLNVGGTIDHGGERLDIYKITYNEEKKKWSKPENLGSTINSPYDEACVYISPDGKTLYFSSEGHTAIGGLDIFKSEWVDGKWSAPENIGYPVNTPSNDIFITVSSDQSSFFMDSDRRKGSGDKDIYEVINLNKVPVPLEVRVFDAVTRKPVNAVVELKQQGKQDSIPLAKSGTGDYSTKLASFKKYDLHVGAPGYRDFDTTFNSNITDPNNIGIREDVYLYPNGMYVLNGHIYDANTRQKIASDVQVTPVGTDSSTVVGTAITDFEQQLKYDKEYLVVIKAVGYPTYEEKIKITGDLEKDFLLGRLMAIKNIYFDFDKYSLRTESVNDLKLLKEMLDKNPTMKVQIQGHTDNYGSAQYNYGLSNRRARAAVNWLIAKGVDPKRITYKGFGLDRPASTNATDEGRQLNRRVEFILNE